jgi:membrane-associated phospholipid phosphatase
MVLHRIKCVFLALIAATAFSLGAPASASEKDWDNASDVARNALVAAAFVVPVAENDAKGIKQAAFALGATQLVTSGLKGVIHEQRPDHSDDNSFPSGHTSISFASAATLEKRYGWQVGIPAHVVAAFVGLARVEARKHYIHDVLVGAAIGETAGWLVTSKRDSKVQWLPWGDAHGGGASVAMRF